MSQGEDGLMSQNHSVEMASQGSQIEVEVEMETECTAAQPLEGALENIYNIEFGQWNVRSTWRQPEDHSITKQDQTAKSTQG